MTRVLRADIQFFLKNVRIRLTSVCISIQISNHQREIFIVFLLTLVIIVGKRWRVDQVTY